MEIMKCPDCGQIVVVQNDGTIVRHMVFETVPKREVKDKIIDAYDRFRTCSMSDQPAYQ